MFDLIARCNGEKGELAMIIKRGKSLAFHLCTLRKSNRLLFLEVEEGMNTPQIYYLAASSEPSFFGHLCLRLWVVGKNGGKCTHRKEEC